MEIDVLANNNGVLIKVFEIAVLKPEFFIYFTQQQAVGTQTPVRQQLRIAGEGDSAELPNGRRLYAEDKAVLGLLADILQVCTSVLCHHVAAGEDGVMEKIEFGVKLDHKSLPLVLGHGKGKRIRLYERIGGILHLALWLCHRILKEFVCVADCAELLHGHIPVADIEDCMQTVVQQVAVTSVRLPVFPEATVPPGSLHRIAAMAAIVCIIITESIANCSFGKRYVRFHFSYISVIFHEIICRRTFNINSRNSRHIILRCGPAQVTSFINAWNIVSAIFSRSRSSVFYLN